MCFRKYKQVTVHVFVIGKVRLPHNIKDMMIFEHLFVFASHFLSRVQFIRLVVVVVYLKNEILCLLSSVEVVVFCI